MTEYERLFAMNLQQKLKTKIVGKIFVTATKDDALYIQITNSDNLEFKTYLKNFTERMLNGWSSDYAAYEVVQQYTDFVIDQMKSKYFY